MMAQAHGARSAGTGADRGAPAGGAGFDVLIPCYNYGRFLRDAVESVLRQDVDLRILIIDDASQDDSVAVAMALAREDPRIQVCAHDSNRGHIATYNEGIDWADRDFFLLVSADDMLLPGALARVAAAFRMHPEAGMAYGAMLTFDDGTPLDAVLAAGTGAEAQATLLDVADFYRRNKTTNVVPASGTVTRTGLQKAVGGYRSTLPHAGDYEMWLRVASHAPVAALPQALVAVRRHGRNMSTRYACIQDVLQRAASLEELEAHSGPRLPPALLAEMKSYVADEALRLTTIAFAERAPEDVRKLVAASRALDPEIVTRPAWLIYLFKRAVGPIAWSALRRWVRFGAGSRVAETDGGDEAGLGAQIWNTRRTP